MYILTYLFILSLCKLKITLETRTLIDWAGRRWISCSSSKVLVQHARDPAFDSLLDPIFSLSLINVLKQARRINLSSCIQTKKTRGIYVSSDIIV